MGCDIHSFLDYNHNGNWLTIKSIPKFINFQTILDQVSDQDFVSTTANFCFERNYQFFSLLSEVRGAFPSMIKFKQGEPDNPSQPYIKYKGEAPTDFHSEGSILFSDLNIDWFSPVMHYYVDSYIYKSYIRQELSRNNIDFPYAQYNSVPIFSYMYELYRIFHQFKKSEIPLNNIRYCFFFDN